MKSFFKVLTLLPLTALFACEPEKPADETLNKLHGDPAEATITLQEGKYTSDSVFVASGTLQKVTYRLQTGMGWAPIAGSDTAFTVQSGSNPEVLAYELRISYKNAQNEDITSQFILDGQDNIHQHFFIPKQITNTADKSASSISATDALLYRYMDTTPWNGTYGTSGVSLTGKTSPLGFKGMAYFPTAGIHYNLNIELLHALESKYKYDRNTEKLSPYYKPSSYHRAVSHWDVKMTIPVYVK